MSDGTPLALTILTSVPRNNEFTCSGLGNVCRKDSHFKCFTGLLSLGVSKKIDKAIFKYVKVDGTTVERSIGIWTFDTFSCYVEEFL
jgi:hypothetical protein